jgi:uncharacterized protein (DUF1800 family)
MADSLPPLDRLDPARAWGRWEPGSGDPWGRKWAGHLYRRAAFGAGPAELADAEKDGPAGTIDRLLAGGPRAASLVSFLEREGAKVARRGNEGELRGWWLYAMLNGDHPLREKLTLFWHNHFATSIGKVQRPLLMFNQNCVLRRHALGKFGPLLLDMSRDAAMLVWLDSNSNLKGRPNENYAREVMELFSLGVGHYTEQDIREAARAFTGWHTDGEGFDFNPRFHDGGDKTVLGTTGPLDGGDVVAVILKQPATARFLVRKLYRFFVSEAQEPPEGLLEPLAESFRQSDYDVAALVRTMLSSRLFFSDHAYRQRVKSPVEYVLGAVRTTVEGPVPQQALVPWLERMGQSLFAPPNVKGWPGGQAWLSTAAMLARQNFAQALAVGTLWNGFTRPGATAGPAALARAEAERRAAEEAARAAQEAAQKMKPGAKRAGPPDRPEEPPPPAEFDPARLTRAAKAATPEDVVRVLVDDYLPGGVRESARARLVAFVAEGSPAGAALDRRVREAAHAVLSLPEYQLA